MSTEHAAKERERLLRQLRFMETCVESAEQHARLVGRMAQMIREEIHQLDTSDAGGA